MRSFSCKPAQHKLVASLALALSLLTGALAAEPAQVGPTWSALTPAQQHVLAPLAKDWQQLTLDGKQKWMEIATRFPSMPADQQVRMQDRMHEWSRMTPQQRGQARANFQQAQQVPSQDRQAQWEAYKALPKERKDALALRAAQPAVVPTPAQPGTRALRTAPLNAQAPKSNLVGSSPMAAPPPRPVAPTLVQVGPGATTSLVGMPAKPPVHQAAGKPKIEAGPSMVDRSTLLPKRGPQAVGSLSSAVAASQPVAAR